MKYLTKSELGQSTVITLSGLQFVLNDLFLFLRERERKRISKRERERTRISKREKEKEREETE